MENRISDLILLSYLQGQATTNEIEIIRSWLASDPDNQAILESTKIYWENSIPAVKSLETDEAFDRYMKKYQSKTSDSKVINLKSRNRKHTSSWLKIAASILIVLGTMAAIYQYTWKTQSPLANLNIETVTKQNPRGQKLTTFLPDGSKVILNSLSSIKYQKPFNSKERVVELVGEAFFDVKKNPEKPFKVVSNNVTTTALGTSFNINSKRDKETVVALVTGKVEVTNGSNGSVFLSPGNSAIAFADGSLKTETFDYLDKVAWKDGMMAFTNNSMDEIINKIEDWYGVDVNVNKEYLNQFNYTASYKNKSLEEVLAGISFVLHFEYEIIENSIHINFNQSN